MFNLQTESRNFMEKDIILKPASLFNVDIFVD
jgi:hypothetical protein